MSRKAIWAASALAVLSGLPGLAAAQSNVTMYGIVDAYATRVKGAVTGVNAQDKTLNRLESGGMSTSRLGFRGTEDLGSGLAASFDLSTFIRNDTGQSGRSDAIGAPINVAADPFWSRAAWVGLSSTQWGRLRFGNVPTLLWVGTLSSNAFGDSTVFSPINLVTFIGGPLTGNTVWTNSAVYDSPEWSGFSVGGDVSAGEGQGGRNSGLRASFARGPAFVAINWQNVKKNPTTFADGTSPNNTKTWQLTGTFDFGVAKLYGHFGRIQNDGTETAPLNVRYDVWDLSASVPIGTGFVLAGYASRKTDDAVGAVPATAATGNKERRVFTLGYDHYLSKRTDLYAMLMNDKTTTNTLPAPGRLVDASATNFAVGVRHRF